MVPDIELLLMAGDAELRDFLRAALPAQGFRLQEAVNGSPDLTGVLSVEPDLILVDLAPPDGDGIEVIRQIRAEMHTPIVALCRRDDEQTTVAALDCGADDYVTKPVTVGNLVVHMRSILRRTLLVRKNMDISTAS